MRWSLDGHRPSSRMRVIAALVAAALFAVFAVEGSPASRGFAAEASLQGKKFVSKKYGYEFVFPAEDYAAFYAAMAWNLKIFPSGGTGFVDVVAMANISDRKFIAAATRLSTGTTLRKFEASYIALLQEGDVCKKARALRNTTLGGVAAREFTIPCPDYDVIAVVAIHRGRGYFFQAALADLQHRSVRPTHLRSRSAHLPIHIEVAHGRCVSASLGEAGRAEVLRPVSSRANKALLLLGGATRQHPWRVPASGKHDAGVRLAATNNGQMRRYHVTTFGCQMNAHDSERIKGMLESLGLGEAPAPEARMCSSSTPARSGRSRTRSWPRTSATRRRGSAAQPDLVVAVGGCYAEAQRERIFERYPFVDVAFGPGSIPHLGEWIETGGYRRPAGPFRHARDVRRDASHAPRAPASAPGCRSRWAATRSARTASSRRCEAVSRAGARARSSPRSKRSPATASRRSRCSGRTSTRGDVTWHPTFGPSSASFCARATRSTASNGSGSRALIRRTSASL